MAFLGDDDVVVHLDAERLGDLDDRLRHLHVGARGRRVARGVVVHHATARSIALILFDFGLRRSKKLGSVMGVGKECSFVMIMQRHAGSQRVIFEHVGSLLARPLCPPKRRKSGHTRRSEKGHVWTAPAVQEESDVLAKRSGAAMYTACFRLEGCLLRDAAAVAAGPDVIR